MEERRGKMKERMAGMKEKIKPALIVIAVLLIAYCAWYSYDRFFTTPVCQTPSPSRSRTSR